MRLGSTKSLLINTISLFFLSLHLQIQGLFPNLNHFNGSILNETTELNLKKKKGPIAQD